APAHADAAVLGEQLAEDAGIDAAEVRAGAAAQDPGALSLHVPGEAQAGAELGDARRDVRAIDARERGPLGVAPDVTPGHRLAVQAEAAGQPQAGHDGPRVLEEQRELRRGERRGRCRTDGLDERALAPPELVDAAERELALPAVDVRLVV